jgi:putative nucleotidyltransferase with HDIG domain
MPKTTFEKNAPIEEIRTKLRLLNALNSFVVFVLVAIIFVYIYEPARGFLDFLPEVSITSIIVIVLVLTFIGSYLSRMLAKKVLDSIRKYSNELDGILNITKEIKEEIYGDLLLDKIIDCSVAITRSDAGYILLLDGEKLLFKVAKGGKISDLSGKSIPKDKGIAGKVLETGAPLFANHLKKSSGVGSSVEGIAKYKATAALCVPLKKENKVVGAIELLNKQEGDYDNMDVELLRYLADQAAISMERAKFYEDQRNYEIHVTDMVTAAIDNLVPGKQGHSKRVARYVNMLTKAVDMPEERRRKMYFAGLLHDIGYLRGPNAPESRKEKVLKHSTYGYDMLNSINFYKDIAPFVLHHHERYDGRGFPRGLKGEDIPLESRILAVADTFDKVVISSSSGDYADPLKEMQKVAGTQLDPVLVELFAKDVEGSF